MNTLATPDAQMTKEGDAYTIRIPDNIAFPEGTVFSIVVLDDRIVLLPKNTGSPDSSAEKPKSYLTDAARDRLRAEGITENGICAEESGAALNAGDEEASWAWLARAKLPAHTLRFLRWQHGSDFIREKGFDTTRADQEFGPDWLDKEDPLWKR